MPRQQKPSKPKEAEQDFDVEPLNHEEIKLIEAWVEGKSLAECYQAGYGAEGYGKASLYVKASRKFSQAHIQRAMAQISAAGIAKLGIRYGDDLDQLVAEEYAFYNECRMAGQYGAAGLARDRIYKLRGFYVDQHLHMNVELKDPQSLLDKLHSIDPHLARMTADRFGIPWKPMEVISHAA